MRRSPLSSSARRRGQALLLAVLIMIFAALLSAAFIGIVAVNLHQTARQGDKNLALDSARSGLEYVNRQLTYGPQGERWLPKMVSTPPDKSTDLIKYNLYYSTTDQVQGWTDGFSKFPNPLGIPTDGPNYLAKVERVPLTTAPGSADFDNVGALKITIIGLSPDDPTAFHRIVAYKGGINHSPVGNALRVVSNYDFKTDATLVAKFDGGTNTGVTGATPLLGVNGATGDFTSLGTPFSITVSNPGGTVATIPGVVKSVATNGTGAYIFTLAKPLASAATSGMRIELAANLGGADSVNASNARTPVPVAFATPLSISDVDTSANLPNEVDGARVNGGLIWSGTLSAQKLRPPTKSFGFTAANPPLIPGTIQSSGTMAIDTAASVAISDGTNSDTLVGSSGLAKGVFNTSFSSDKDLIVRDGWNRIRGVPSSISTSRSVADFRPPVFDEGDGLARYRDLARNSLAVDSIIPSRTAPASGALYGNGQGIYIDNKSDREMILDGTLREMKQDELTKMWLSQRPAADTAAPDDYFRTGTPSALNTTSLEQQHLRGWVSPDEFRARGVEIELGANQITVTRDPRSDGTYRFGGDPSKTWKKPDGSDDIGRYTEVLPWPVNGVIFAEGNIRIKGNATGVPRSLTVVSMGNIYIEDSLSASGTGTPKILLLAKKNVVMNPTRVMGRPDIQTTVASGGTLTFTAGVSGTLAVQDGTGFKIGDFVQALSTSNVYDVQGYVTNATATSLTLNVTKGGTVSVDELITTPSAPTTALASTSLATKLFGLNQIALQTDVIQRRVSVPTTVALANLRVALNHEGSRVPALTVKAASTGTVPFTDQILFSNKGSHLTPAAAPYLNFAANTSNQADDRLFATTSGPGGVVTDSFPPALPTTKAAADAYTLANLVAAGGDLNGKTHTNGLPAPLDISWEYTTTLPTPAHSTIPYYWLAGVGSRADFLPTTVATDRRQQINTSSLPAGVTYSIPLSTSIVSAVNGVPSTMLSQNWNTTLTAYERAAQFGFNAKYLDNSPTIPDQDILTQDQSFYSGDSIYSTLDSRRLVDAASATTGFGAGVNSLVFREADGIDAANSVFLPSYMLLGSKLENVALSGTDSSVTSVAPAYTFNVNAYVYAQTGSWFVIPTPIFDERLRGTLSSTYLDLNLNGVPNAGEYIEDATPGFNAGDYADLNRNGTIEPFEKTAMMQFSRYNYSINFLGAIAENQTQLINDANDQAKGAVSTWMDKLATVNYSSTTGVTYDRIKYIFDPTYAQGQLVDDPGFLMPQTPELYNIS